MAVLFSVRFLGVLGIIEVVCVLGWWAVCWKNARAQKIQEAKEARLRLEEETERPKSAWLRTLATEHLPRCEFCQNAGLGEAAIGHSVYDVNGEIECPVLQKRKDKQLLQQRDTNNDAQDSDKPVNLNLNKTVNLNLNPPPASRTTTPQRGSTPSQGIRKKGTSMGRQTDRDDSTAVNTLAVVKERVLRQKAELKGNETYQTYEPYPKSRPPSS
eukprot:CAMPEP_0173080606 /NCGR_PEP_ID=MMETSP1102-20130122/16407_1 /TAXON_ID=49646 /ORGANISM="Geminigera sp., Strain Caron Lab Isolate" /LENGTH=213 /DNA_ID=CAMNT_0013954287 /DNA_START=16 /DNA_END=657 /DNA_ORIENTATION=-